MNLALCIRTKGRKIKRYPKCRFCRHCGKRLSIYNPNRECWAYHEAIQDRRDHMNEEWCRERGVFAYDREGKIVLIKNNGGQDGKSENHQGGDMP